MTTGIVAAILLAGALGGDSCKDVCQEHPDRVKALFAALNLGYPGLESVKKDVEAGDLPRACDDLLAYYRNGASGAWLRRTPPQPGTGQVPGADAILNDTFTADTISMKVPRLPDGHLDWACNGPLNDREWGWDLNRHFWSLELLNAFFATGNPIYAKGLDGLLRDWIVSSPYPGVKSDTPQWRGLEAFFRGGKAWPAVFYGLQQVDLLTPAARILMLSSIPEHAHYARNFHKPTGNWITMELLGLATEGACWPEFKDAEEWYQYAVGRLVPELAAQVYPDGVQKELTSDYHRVAMHCFMDIPALAKNAQRPVPPEFRATIERMQNYNAYSVEPNGLAPLNNDSDCEDIRTELCAQSKEFDRPDWLYIATNGKEGEAPKGLPSIMFPWAGEFIMRSGWDADAHWAFFDVGPLGIAHQHYDKLHLSVSAFGRDILVDGGRYHYINDVWRKYFTYSASHNVVLVDGKCQQQYEREATAPLDGSYAITPEYDFARGEYNAGFQDVAGTAIHARSVVYLRGRYFVVVDRVTTDRPRTIQPLWHFHPACTVELEGVDALSTDAGQGNVRIVPAAPFAWRAEIVKERGEPDIQGWWSRHYNVKEPSPCVVYTAGIKETATFAWVIIPGKGPVNAAKAEVVKADNDAVIVRVEYEGKSDTITMPLQSLDVVIHTE